MLNNLNFSDLEPSVSSLVGAIPLIYLINSNSSRSSWKNIPKSAVPIIMGNYLLNSIPLEEEWDVVKKVAQVGLTVGLGHVFVNQRTNSALVKYGSLALAGLAFPLADMLVDSMIYSEFDQDDRVPSFNSVPFPVISGAVSVAGGYAFDSVSAIPLINLGLNSLPMVASVFV
jgi:hypothetical protein